MGTVAIIRQRGIAKHPDIDNKDNSPRYTIFFVYSEHERFVAYYSYIRSKLAISFDKNNMVNASNYLICNPLRIYQNTLKDDAKLMNNL